MVAAWLLKKAREAAEAQPAPKPSKARKPLNEVQRYRSRVRAAANHALKNGRLRRQPCERCGASRVEMHHDDYGQPLAVRWLCKPCHLAHHDAIDPAWRHGYRVARTTGELDRSLAPRVRPAREMVVAQPAKPAAIHPRVATVPLVPAAPARIAPASVRAEPHALTRSDSAARTPAERQRAYRQRKGDAYRTANRDRMRAKRFKP